MARKLSESGMYHIMFRGMNRQNIFENYDDYSFMLRTLGDLKAEMHFEIYVYCLMSNHVHILMKEKNIGDISLIMKRLLTKYVRRYNLKYDRSGSLIANRYKSQAVEVDEYFLSLVRYIHQNPIKAGLVDNLEDYQYSSYRDYTGRVNGITDTEFVLNTMKGVAFDRFNHENEDEVFLVDDKTMQSDEEISREIKRKYKISPKTIAAMPKDTRNNMLRILKTSYSIRQIERVTGVSRGIISRM